MWLLKSAVVLIGKPVYSFVNCNFTLFAESCLKIRPAVCSVPIDYTITHRLNFGMQLASLLIMQLSFFPFGVRLTTGHAQSASCLSPFDIGFNSLLL
jgi:hypothetical protein